MLKPRPPFSTRRLASSIGILATVTLAGCAMATSAPEMTITKTVTAYASEIPPTPSESSPTSQVDRQDRLPGPSSTPTMLKEKDTISCLRVIPNVTKFDKAFSPWSFSPPDWVRIEMVMNFRNTCTKSVQAVKGNVVVFDIFGDRILRGQWKESLDLSPGERTTGTQGLGFQYSNQMPEGVALLNSDVEDLEVRFIVDEVVLSGGVRLP